jgi:hypothetical protein
LGSYDGSNFISTSPADVRKYTDLEENRIFPCSIVILIPVCILSLLFADGWADFSIMQALPYLLGSLFGGIAAGVFGKRIPVLCLHRVLGVLILWGGIRYLC